MPKKLPSKFYQQNTVKVAKKLIGKYLVRKIGRQLIVGQITETEAYGGEHDLASHASRGLTPRTKIMFGPAGYWYVYLIYGMYYCLNIVTDQKDKPGAVLIRAVKPIAGLSQGLKIDGPGKLCRAFKITKKQNGAQSFGAANLWLEDRKIKIPKIKSAKRIGIDYAKEDKDKLWRFYL
ncbi:MAG: hypothetical protein A3B89_03195 [Candidatus Buchananbacteria bacterium RIFCSPHIGHO2_02_FULL_40_13]|uniref:Putative 3-methyladenine DNA glycosylase n=1 Tax=Candidatus Buchananbacteria bacterium RIFCSPLOWO2_01_FULL_39_33 TaxID=1797543 RepID=A0A1G1YGG4_9BACT|nr:MAG: hypothetical protein A2820_01440 [Candidatus Buchananbacteria bacterium RIFCSPHIGHO2_01_FULL_40_35]OGY50195.1 MAG: hypothetical protein A3B89_03195 [Candidatus Buchananbacteria bacterium RIFCSPHIGHO2_02_FULL_40_13]OGY51448.1 MAG: hypothetical protein A3A02_04650 [Candidatus Buchananbacteria bacterium RIFCSPLOWO2_01_FULL_39_33]